MAEYVISQYALGVQVINDPGTSEGGSGESSPEPFAVTDTAFQVTASMDTNGTATVYNMFVPAGCVVIGTQALSPSAKERVEVAKGSSRYLCVRYPKPAEGSTPAVAAAAKLASSPDSGFDLNVLVATVTGQGAIVQYLLGTLVLGGTAGATSGYSTQEGQSETLVASYRYDPGTRKFWKAVASFKVADGLITDYSVGEETVDASAVPHQSLT